MAEKEQKKRGGCLKWVVIIFGVLILLGACGALLGGGDESSTDTSTEESTETETVEAESDTDETAEETETETESGEQEESATEDEEVVEEEQAEEVVGIGEMLDVDGIEFTVNDWYQQDSVGSALSSTANDTYIVMNLSVVNNKNEAITIDSTFFKIVDDERVFEPDSNASMYANDDGIGLFLESINPGSSRTANIVFDVTQDVVDSQDKQLQAQSGFWGTETGIINLQ